MASEIYKLDERIINHFENDIDLTLRKKKGTRKYIYQIIKQKYNLMYGTKLEELKNFFNNKENYKIMQLERNNDEYIIIKFSNKNNLSFNW